MGNSSSQQVFFGTDPPEALRENEDYGRDRASLEAALACIGSEKEKQLLAAFLADVDPAYMQENAELCEFLALAFLRYRRYDPVTARERFDKYIAWRLKTFGNLGPQDLDSPLKNKGEEAEADGEGGGEAQSGGSKKSNTTRELLDLGVLCLVQPATPQHQRIVLLRFQQTRPSQFKHHARHVTLAAHYILIQALRASPQSQVMGVVFIADFAGAGLSNIDRRVPPKMGKLLSGVLPVRLGGLLMCNPNTIVRIVVPLAKMFLSEKLGQRIVVVPNNEQLTTELGIPQACVPDLLGGQAKYSTTSDLSIGLASS